MKEQFKPFNNRVFIATFIHKEQYEEFYFNSVNEAKEYLMDFAFINYNNRLKGYLKCNNFYKIAEVLSKHDIHMNVSINLNDVNFIKVDFENEKYDNQVTIFSVDGFTSWVNDNLLQYDEPKTKITQQDAFKYASKEGAEIWIKYND